ncbi:hypothetical protein LT330_004409 [Penicillium expansum]|nr:hypothetical protein LT330_004409 [Penicillium expansum]
MIPLLRLPNELLLLISTKLESEEDLSHLLQANRRLYDLLLPRLYQQNVKLWKSEGLANCAATGNERGVRHFLYWGAYVDVQVLSTIRKKTDRFIPPMSLHTMFSGRRPTSQARNPFMVPPRALLKVESQTPLSIAAHAGHDDIVRLLLEHGAQLNDCVGKEIWTGPNNPAVGALLAGHESVFRILLEWGAQKEGPNLLYGGLINCAVASGQMPMLKLLIEFGVDTNAEVNGMCPLLWAVRRKPNYASMVEVLLDNGANVALVDNDREKLLFEAISRGTVDTVHLLLKHGANCHESVLHGAIRESTLETVRLLLDHGAHVNFESITHAVISRNCDILELLIDYGFDLNSRGYKGYTILHYAIRCSGMPSHMPSDGVISGYLVQPVFKCPTGPDPPHVSAYCRRRRGDHSTAEDIVRCLIRRGADVNAMNGMRETPLYLAWKYASPAVQHLLLEHGADWTAMLTIY